LSSYSHHDNIFAPAVAVALLSIVLAGCASQQEKADEPQQEEVPSSSPSSDSAEQSSGEQSETGEQEASGDGSQSESEQGQSGEAGSQQGESEQGESGEGASGEQSSDTGSQNGSAESAGSEAGQQTSGSQGSQQSAGTAGQTSGTGEQGAGESGMAGSSGAYGGSNDGAAGVPMGTGDTADLDRILNESLGEFDGTMAAEQEILASSGQGSAQSAREREGQDATAVVSASNGSGLGGVPEQEGAYGDGAGSYGGDTQNADNGVQNSAGAQAGDADGLTEEQRQERMPDDIPSDGTGEDVVARQIRELAMQEEDPELREAIWDEYRKHTGIKK
jgi:hypothetical protein